MRLIKVFWYILTSAGPVYRAGRHADRLFRYYVLKVLDDLGLFEFLRTPRTYGEILAEFGFIDIDYTRSLMEILSSDEDQVLIREGEMYRNKNEHPLPDLEQIVKRTDPRIRGFVVLAESMTRYVLPRLRQEPISLSKSFEQDGREFMSKFDRVLADKIYSAMRNAAFAYLKPGDLSSLRGKRLIDVGCGSGRETAELWLKFNGDIHITAIDPVHSLIELAEQNFETHLKEIDPNHPPVTKSNRPVFKVASATRMPFEDDEFDASFWLFVLHWTPDPRMAIRETVRVVHPGGLLFGGQTFKPMANAYFDLAVRSNENCYGFFWQEDYMRWFSELGIDIDLAPVAGMLRAFNTKNVQH